MLVKVEKNELQNGIIMAMGATSVSATQPILSCLLFEVSDGGIQITGNNLEMSIRTAVITDNYTMDKQTGKAAIGARKIADIIKNLPDGEVQIRTNDKHVTTITCGRSTFKVAGMDPDEYPTTIDIEPTGSFSISANVLKDMIRQTLFCAAPGATNPLLTGALFNASSGCLEICALDMYRVAHSKKMTDYNGNDFKLVVPARVLAEVAKLLTGKNNVTLTYDERNVWFDIDGVKVMSKHIYGEFFNYVKIFSADRDTRINVGRIALIESMTRATLVEDKGKVAVKLTVSDNAMQISSTTALSSLNDEIAINGNGNDLTIAFNPNYFIEALRVMASDSVEMQFSGPSSPCLIRPVSSEGSEQETSYIVVPLKAA